jgi:hypothetical protein
LVSLTGLPFSFLSDLQEESSKTKQMSVMIFFMFSFKDTKEVFIQELILF